MKRRGSASLSFALRRLASVQLARPWWVVIVCAAIAALAGLVAARLELRTRFDQLLPDNQPSVVELRRLADRTGGQSNAFVVLEGQDEAVLRAMGDDLVSELRALKPDWMTGAEDGVQSSRAYLEPRAGLFADLSDLTKLRDDLDARWQWEVGQETGSNLDDDGAPPAVTAADIRARFVAARFHEADRFPNGYFESRDRRALVVIAHTAVAAGDLARARSVLGRIRSVVERVAREGVRVSYAGDLVTGLSEYGAVRADLIQVGALGVGLVLTVIFVFFMRLRALVALGATIAAGLAWTFGATAIAIGHLNVATGFLFSIVAGNGINFGIIYMSRYFEERRVGTVLESALAIAHERTWPSTLTAAVAAAAAYGSLGVTDFRAFKHFAFIGAFGMIACWIASYTLLPSVLVLFERARPFRLPLASTSSPSLLQRLRMGGVPYGAPIAAVVARAPRTIASLGVALALLGAALLVSYVRSDPMEYDMRKLQNDVGQSREMYRVAHLASDVLGARVEGTMAVALDRFEQVRPFIAILEARAAASAPGDKPFEAVHSLLDFVPDAQGEKIPLLRQIRERLIRAHERGLIAQADWTELSSKLPPDDLQPFGVDDLPAELARPFTERDGTRGRLVLIEPTAGKSDADLRYLLKWADSFRETRLPDGEVVHGSGRAVIFADMIQSVVRDIPRCVALSLAMTVLALGLTFRRGSSVFGVLGALAAGIAWVVLAMVLTRTKIHFLNFVALPITFGIGVDYAVNFAMAYEVDGRRSILDVLRKTGSAVILCSLTTTLGYLALLSSVNQAVRGLGMLAAIGEVACLAAAVLVLPAALLWRERARRGGDLLPAPSDALPQSERRTWSI
jgi:predicted RND superfamily exporter protein